MLMPKQDIFSQFPGQWEQTCWAAHTDTHRHTQIYSQRHRSIHPRSHRFVRALINTLITNIVDKPQERGSWVAM